MFTLNLGNEIISLMCKIKRQKEPLSRRVKPIRFDTFFSEKCSLPPNSWNGKIFYVQEKPRGVSKFTIDNHAEKVDPE